MASMLAEWDSKAALPVLKARVERCAQVVQAGQKAGERFHGLEVGHREPDRSSHPGGRPGGARRLRRLGPHRHARIISTSPRSPCSSPCGETPTIPRSPPRPPRCSKTRNRPGTPRSGAATPPSRKGTSGICSPRPLLGLKAFRTLVIRALGDKTEVGTVETDAKGRVIVDPGSLQDRQR